MVLTTCGDPVYGDGKRSLGCRDGFFISSSSFSRILLSASNNLSGEFIMTSRSSAQYLLATAYSEGLSSQTLWLAFRGLIHARLTTATYRLLKHQSSFDPPFSQLSDL